MRVSISVACLATLLSSTAAQPAHATASASPYGSQFSGFLLINRGEGSLQSLSFTPTLIEQSTFSWAEGNAGAIAQAQGIFQQTPTDRNMSVSSRIRVGASAEATGHAIAEARQIYDFQLVNTSAQELVFEIRGFYGIGTHVEVDDVLTESLLTYWNLSIQLDMSPIYRFGENRSTVCDYPQVDYYACLNTYDLSDDISGHSLSLDAGESITGRITTIARFEVTAVPEPSSLALLIGASLGYLGYRGRRRLI